MKTLFYVQTEVDWGADVFYYGLCKALGAWNVFEYPEKPTYHTTGALPRYSCLFNNPINKTDEEKVEMLKNDEFDRIIVSCIVGESGQEPVSRFEGEFYELLKEKSKTIPTFIIDMGDRPGIREDLKKDLNCELYFKREFMEGDKVRQLNYSYPDMYLPDSIDTERTTDLFWAGSFNSYRRKFLEAVGASKKTYSQEDYRKELLKAKIGLSLRGFGYDTVRYYEIPAHGALLLSQRLPIKIRYDFVDGETAVFFDTPEELKEKLDYLLKNPDYLDKIRLAGHKWLVQHHVTSTRMKYFFRRIGIYGA